MPLAIELSETFVAVMACLFGSIGTYLAMAFFGTPKQTSINPYAINAAAPVFLFDGNCLIDTSDTAHEMITQSDTDACDLEHVVAMLNRRFNGLAETIANLTPGSRETVLGAENDPLWLEVNRADGLTRITLYGQDGIDGTAVAQLMTQDAQTSELSMLRDLVEDAPQLIWQEDEAGNLKWANEAYLEFADRLRGGQNMRSKCLPGGTIFPELQQTIASKTNSVHRLSAPDPSGQFEHWFDITSVRRGDKVVHYAADANAIVRAEVAQRSFVQTFSKTFAQLSTGLAIFDRERRLATFNPALLDLTGLPFDFLSGQPTVDMVFDRLRETQMLPEPKNYITWRDRFTAMEKAAHAGSYCENWDLPEGQTFRVTGRPHPDGTIAFFFEDITAEISLTRRFRTEIETGQVVLDSIDQGIAVFSNSGTLVMQNDAYNKLWSRTCASIGEDLDLRSEMRLWRNASAPSALWDRLKCFFGQTGDRQMISDQIVMDDGRVVDCKATPISGGMTMLKFDFTPALEPRLRKLSGIDPSIRAFKQ